MSTGKIKQLAFSEGTAVTAPTDGFTQTRSIGVYASDAAFVTAKGVAAAAGDFYFNSVSNAVKEYDGTAWRTVATRDGVETLAGKTLLTPVVDDYAEINEETAPGTPAAGKVRLYAKSGGKLYFKDSTGTEYTIADTAAALTNPMSAVGDLIYGSTAGAATRLAHVGVDRRVLRSTSASALGWGQIDNPDFFTSAAEATQNAAGVVKSAGQLLGTNTNDNAGSGYVGQYLVNNRNTSLAVGSAGSAVIFSCDTGNSTVNDGNEVGITLTAGDWDLQGSLTITVSPAVTSFGRIATWIGTAKGNSSAGRNLNQNYAGITGSFLAASGETVSICTPTWRVTVANGATATYYLKGQCGYTIGSGNLISEGILRARRVR